jgi:hypothetical protein
MKVIRGDCNRCGQCCGKDNNIPPFGWSFFETCLQTNPDFPESALPEGQRTLFQLTKTAFDIPRQVLIGGKVYDILVKTGVGLVKSDTNHSCPFLLTDGACGIWDNNVSWQQQLCHNVFPYDGFELSSPELEERFTRFKQDHPSCSYYVNDE